MNYFEDSATCARQLDESDSLADVRSHFHIPKQPDGEERIYLCGNSLGLMPKSARAAVEEVLDDWQSQAVDAHVNSQHPWMPYHQLVREPLARLVGAKPIEVVAMNSLTVNLHLMMVSFYRPSPQRQRIVIERGAFPSDRHAVMSQIEYHGLDPSDALVELERDVDLPSWLGEHGQDVALVLWPGVQYYSGHYYDLAAITKAAQRAGCRVGFDLAHAAGNLPLELHEWGCDFAVWCTYKYLNSGPGAVAGCFVHERHAHSALPRFKGWWGHDPESRFEMGPEFVAAAGADGWQISNPPIFAMAPLRSSLELFDRVGMASLRAKSVQLTGFLEFLLHARLANAVESLTPKDPDRRGCQLSLRLQSSKGKQVFDQLGERGIVCDWREPAVIRVAPAPLYNRFEDVYQFVESLEAILHQA